MSPVGPSSPLEPGRDDDLDPVARERRLTEALEALTAQLAVTQSTLNVFVQQLMDEAESRRDEHPAPSAPARRAAAAPRPASEPGRTADPEPRRTTDPDPRPDGPAVSSAPRDTASSTVRPAEPRRAPTDPWAAGPSSPGAWVPRPMGPQAAAPMSALRPSQSGRAPRPSARPATDPADRQDPPDALTDHVRVPPETPPGR